MAMGGMSHHSSILIIIKPSRPYLTRSHRLHDACPPFLTLT